jgi:hypothetical protein
VSETHATTAEFPPGRYGHRRDGRRRLGVPVAFGVVVLAISVLLAFRLYDRFGDPAYEARIVGWSAVTDTSMTIEFTVRVPAGATAECVLRARSYDGAEVGRGTVRVTNATGGVTVTAREPVATSARASHGDVVRCRPVQ